MNDELFDEYFRLVERFGLYPSKVGLKFHLDYLFQGISFYGKTMLEIGAGTGLHSLYGACMGARQVICLEPELAGSTRGTLNKLIKLSQSLPQYNIIPQAVTFQDFDSSDQTFDIILLYNSINHLDEEACINLQHSDSARNRYNLLFQKLGQLAAKGAKLIIADCSRYNFFALIGLRNPLAPNIGWRGHQSPNYWSKMLRDFSFINPEIRWTSPSNRLLIGRLFFRNRFMAYFTTSHFSLIMEKK